jgi:hypothetical protein
MIVDDLELDFEPVSQAEAVIPTVSTGGVAVMVGLLAVAGWFVLRRSL